MSILVCETTKNQPESHVTSTLTNIPDAVAESRARAAKLYISDSDHICCANSRQIHRARTKANIPDMRPSPKSKSLRRHHIPRITMRHRQPRISAFRQLCHIDASSIILTSEPAPFDDHPVDIAIAFVLAGEPFRPWQLGPTG